MAKRTVPAEEIVASAKKTKKKQKESIKVPSKEDFTESFSPDLSEETFKIADKSFRIRISSIRVQKIMAKSLDSITELIKKIDIIPIFTNLQNKMQRERQKMVDRVETGDVADDKEALAKVLKEIGDDSSDDYMHLVEIVRDVIQYGGLSNILITIMDLYTGVVYAICHAQDESITLDWVEDNMGIYEAQAIFFRQMEKDKIGGRVVDFLHILTRQLLQEAG